MLEQAEIHTISVHVWDPVESGVLITPSAEFSVALSAALAVSSVGSKLDI